MLWGDAYRRAEDSPAKLGNTSADLRETLEILKTHQAELQSLGVRHAAVFGSVARGQARPDSDVDVLVDLDPERPIGVFEYARLKLYLGELLGGAGDIVNRKTVKPLFRESILRDCVNGSKRTTQGPPATFEAPNPCRVTHLS